MYLSADSGANWVPSGSFTDRASVASSADGRKLVVAVYDGGIYTLEMQGPAPVLNIQNAKVASGLIISWPIPSTAFVLQQSPSLSPQTWVDVSTAPTFNPQSLQYEISIPLPTGTQFFRLTQR